MQTARILWMGPSLASKPRVAAACSYNVIIVCISIVRLAISAGRAFSQRAVHLRYRLIHRQTQQTVPEAGRCVAFLQKSFAKQSLLGCVFSAPNCRQNNGPKLDGGRHGDDCLTGSRPAGGEQSSRRAVPDDKNVAALSRWPRSEASGRTRLPAWSPPPTLIRSWNRRLIWFRPELGWLVSATNSTQSPNPCQKGGT